MTIMLGAGPEQSCKVGLFPVRALQAHCLCVLSASFLALRHLLTEAASEPPLHPSQEERTVSGGQEAGVREEADGGIAGI